MTALFVRLSIVFGVLTGRLSDRRDRGATAVEYGLLVGLIAVVIIGAVGLLGGRLDGLFDGVVRELPNI